MVANTSAPGSPDEVRAPYQPLIEYTRSRTNAGAGMSADRVVRVIFRSVHAVRCQAVNARADLPDKQLLQEPKRESHHRVGCELRLQPGR